MRERWTRRSWHGGRPQPPWWPVNEPWPPERGPHAWRRGRSRFVRRAGVFIAAMLFLSMVGLATVLSWIVNGRGAAAQPFRLPPIAAAVVVSVAVLGLARIAMQRFGTPVGDIIDASNRVAEGDFAARLNEQGPRPVRTVARAFNSMTTRLQAQDAQRKHLMADIAHELRNPLAVLQGRLEGMLDGVYPRDEAQIAAVLDETRVLARLVDDLRTLAHAESGMLTLRKESTDLAILIHEAVTSLSIEAAAAQVSIATTARDSGFGIRDSNGTSQDSTSNTAPDLPLIDIDPLRIREVLTNLLSNALRHTPPGGTVTVSATRLAGAIEVSVRDTGSGIAAEEVANIFDRFYKGRSSRGSGLGLTIARNLVVAHGGEIRADSSPGRGTTVAFTLPAPAPPPGPAPPRRREAE